MIYSNNFIDFDFDGKLKILNIIVKKDIPTREEVMQLIKQIENFYIAFDKEDIKFYLCCDIRKIGIVPMSYIKEIANFFTEKKKYTEKLVISTSIIIDNPTVRTIFSTFFMIYKTIKPLKFVKNNEEAIEFFKSTKFGERMNVSDLG